MKEKELEGWEMNPLVKCSYASMKNRVQAPALTKRPGTAQAQTSGVNLWASSTHTYAHGKMGRRW